jgi:hypothetical protein
MIFSLNIFRLKKVVSPTEGGIKTEENPKCQGWGLISRLKCEGQGRFNGSFI